MEGLWIGMTLDKPLGKNDGSVQGVRYFACEALHGLFIRSMQIVTESAAASLNRASVSQSTSMMSPNKDPNDSSDLDDDDAMPEADMCNVATALYISPQKSQASYKISDLKVVGNLGDGAFGKVCSKPVFPLY